MEEYTITLKGPASEVERWVGAYAYNSPAPTWSTGYSVSKPKDWPFVDPDIIKLTEVKLSFPGSKPGHDGWGTSTPYTNADIKARTDENSAFSTTRTALFGDPGEYIFSTFPHKGLCEDFSTFYLDFQGYPASTGVYPINAYFIMPEEISLKFTYEYTYAALTPPVWTTKLDEYKYNGIIYVSNKQNSPLERDRLELTWNMPTLGDNIDIPEYCKLYANITHNGKTKKYTIKQIDYKEGESISEKGSVKIDLANFTNSNGTKINLSEGDKIVFSISITGKYHGESSTRSTAAMYVNHYPTAPEILNSIIPSNQTSASLRYKLGTDKDNEEMPVSFRWRKNGGAWRTTTRITLTDITDPETAYYAYTYDGWDVSSYVKFFIRQNAEPKLKVQATYKSSIENGPIDKITDIQVSEVTSKTLTNKRYYIRSSTQKNTLSQAKPKQIYLNSDNEYIIDPFDINSPVYAGNYYQFGAQAYDGVEDSDIYWHTLDKPNQIYGGIELKEEHIPKIIPTDILDTENLFGNYSNFYKALKIKINYQLPEAPTGLEWDDLYYQFAYYNGSTWDFLTNREAFSQASKEDSTSSLDIYTKNVEIARPLASIKIRMHIYNAKSSETQALYSGESNILYYANPPSWGDLANNLSLSYSDLDGIMEQDHRRCVRPTIGQDSQNPAFNLAISIPNSVCHLAPEKTTPQGEVQGNPIQDLQYTITISSEKKTITLSTNNVVINTDAEIVRFEKSFTYEQLYMSNIYDLCATNINNRKGPYDLSIAVTFTDPFKNTIKTTIETLTIDFREKPLFSGVVQLGKDGIYNPQNQKITLESFLSNSDDNIIDLIDTTLFPKDDDNLIHKIILNNETLLVSFNLSSSYSAQVVNECYCDLYQINSIENEADILIKSYPITILPNSTYYKVFIGNLFIGQNTYYVKIRAKDSENYNGNITESNPSNILVGIERMKPILDITGLMIEPTEDNNFDYKISDISFVEYNDESEKENTKIRILWPDIYSETKFYNRPMPYITKEYQPACVYGLEFSIYPDFPSDETQTAKINLLELNSTNSFLSSYIKQPDEGKIIGEQTGTIKIGEKIYVRAKAEYKTGFTYNNNQLEDQIEITYSPVFIFSGTQPTVSYRKNAVGINSIPRTNVDGNSPEEVFSVASKGTKNIILFRGEEVVQTEVIQHNICFDLAQGILDGERFIINQSILPIITKQEIDSFTFENLTS